MDGPGQSSATRVNVRPLLRIPDALATLVVLVAGASLTALAWRAAVVDERQRADTELSLRTSDIQSALQDRLLAYEALLRSGAGAINAFWPVSSEQWRRFTAQLRLAAVYPGIHGIGFAARIETSAQLKFWSAVLDPIGANDLTRRVSEHDLPQSAIVFLEPLDVSNRRALGYDMMSEPKRRAAMERARDAGAPALSQKVVLVQDSRRGANAAGFLLYAPVYSTPEVPPTVAQRRSAHLGFVYSPFRAENFFASALPGLPAGLAVEVFDGRGTREDKLLYRSSWSEPTDTRIDARSIQLAGHEWTLRVSAAASPSPKRRSASLIVLAGVSTTLLLASLAHAVAGNRRRLQERLRTELALAQRDKEAALVLENALDAYVAIDSTDTIVEWNRQAALLFGWSAREAIGRRLTDTIVPPDVRQRHFDAIAGFAARTEHPLLGKRLEMPARCRDGSEVCVELSIVQISTSAGVRFAASLRDITQQRRQAAEIRSLTETLEQRVAERTSQLEVANRELSAANRDLEAFAYSVSHDLRAPLRAIDGHLLGFLEQTQTLTQPQHHHATAIRRNVAHMGKLIEDLLNFALIGRRPLRKESVVLWDVVRNILHELPQAPSAVYEVSPDELGAVHADPALLKQALTNLIANALKFSRDASPPRVRIGSEPGEGGNVYFVRDNGVGFDMKHAGKLFGVFERLHQTEDFEGSGVGLAIVKHIIERHGGKVWADAEPGNGASFYFTLP